MEKTKNSTIRVSATELHADHRSAVRIGFHLSVQKLQPKMYRSITAAACLNTVTIVKFFRINISETIHCTVCGYTESNSSSDSLGQVKMGPSVSEGEL